MRSFNPAGTHLLADVVNADLNNGSRKLIEIDLMTGEPTGSSDSRGWCE